MKRLFYPILVFACEGQNSPAGLPTCATTADCPPDSTCNTANQCEWQDLGRTAIDPPVAGIIGLTFDDGPSSLTPDILGVLAKHNAHATFFVIGRNIPGHRDVLDAEQQQGHQIGNHTFYHEPQPTLAADVFSQRTLAVKTNIGDRDNGRLFFRFPYGAAGPDQMQWLTTLEVGGRHYRAVGWNMDSQDWEFGADYPGNPTSTSILDDATTCGAQPNPFQHDLVGWTQYVARQETGGVILFHDIQQITHDHLDEILSGWENPTGYWASLSPAARQTYMTYYACQNVDPNQAFKFEPLYSGTWPALKDP